MNTVIIPSHISRLPLHIYQYIDLQGNPFIAFDGVLPLQLEQCRQIAYKFGATQNYRNVSLIYVYNYSCPHVGIDEEYRTGCDGVYSGII
jgi:hypothetical protein